jgi:hypothetical protein
MHDKSTRPVLTEPLVHKTADLTLSLRYLTQEELISLYGRNDAFNYQNPYYGYPAVITKKNLIVFDFQATTLESTVQFELNKIFLEIDKVTGTAKSLQYLRSIWGHYDNADMSRIERTLKKTILDREFTVSPDQPVSGYLVFGENYQEEGGEGMLSLDVATPSGDEGTIEIPIRFSADGTVEGSGENTGIFSE